MGYFDINCSTCDSVISVDEQNFKIKDGKVCLYCFSVATFDSPNDSPRALKRIKKEEVLSRIEGNAEAYQEAEELLLEQLEEEGRLLEEALNEELSNPRSALAMSTLCENKGYNLGSEKKALEHFSVIANVILPEENVLTAFMVWTEEGKGLDALSVSQAVVATDRRIIVGWSRPIGETSEVIDLGNINNISLEKGFSLSGKVAISTVVGKTTFSLPRENASRIHTELNQALYEFKNNSSQASTPQIIQAPSAPTAADEIRQFKALLDDGIITQEEFDQKKKELLGL